jgi:hypothetical protein
MNGKKGDRMKSLSVKLVVILIGLMTGGYGEVWGEDWKYFGAGGDGIFWWYDTHGVMHHPNRMINVWVKKVRADEIMDRVKSGGKLTLSELEQIASEKNYERVLMEIDCVEKTINFLQKMNYDSKGVLESGESQLGVRKSIPADSVAERLYKAVCQ